MRPMTLLASALFPSMLLAAMQIGCSSDDSSNTTVTYKPFDSGTVVVPAAPTQATSVTVSVVGKGVIVSADGRLEGTKNNGFVGTDGGAPQVDCPGACKVEQGTTLYAYPTITATTTDNVFLGWSTAVDGGAILATDPDFTVGPTTPTPLVALFGAAN